jgi:hypothetical protein
MALHETRVEIARGLRWMREHTPSPGPWNAPRAQPDWGVLSVPSRGAEIAWQARRPVVFSEAGAYGSLESLRAVSKVLRGDEFERSMHSCGARFLVTTSFDEPLALDPSWGLQCVHASPREADRMGHALQDGGAPAISIWELPPPKRDDSGPQMTPR